MGRKQGPRKGSMQFWHRRRADKALPRVNWAPVIATAHKKAETASFLGFIGYKAGMASAFVKDSTPDSMTKGKRIIVPVTVIECPTLKILSVRFYKNKKVVHDVLNDNLEKELIRMVKMPKTKRNAKELIEKIEKEGDYDDVTAVLYSQPKKADIKKTPDISEIGLSGKKEDKVNFLKEHLAKEIAITDVFTKGIVDVRGTTKGKGFQGAVKRFGVHFRNHKAEKGQRKVGSIGGWHPIGVRFNVPRPGGMGGWQRVAYNQTIVSSKKMTDGDALSKRVFDNYGIVTSDYIILHGSVQGAHKKQILLTTAFRPTKYQSKKNYELIELR